MSDRRLYRRYFRRRPQLDVAGVIASICLAVSLFAVPSLIPPTAKKLPVSTVDVGHSHLRGPLPRHPLAAAHVY